MDKVTEADKLATKQHQQRFLSEGRSETELLWEAFATHRIEALEAALREAATKICAIDHYAASDAWKIIKQALEGSGND